MLTFWTLVHSGYMIHYQSGRNDSTSVKYDVKHISLAYSKVIDNMATIKPKLSDSDVNVIEPYTIIIYISDHGDCTT